MPSSSSARMTRTAISPRLATSTLENMGAAGYPAAPVLGSAGRAAAGVASAVVATGRRRDVRVVAAARAVVAPGGVAVAGVVAAPGAVVAGRRVAVAGVVAAPGAVVAAGAVAV